MNLRWYIVLCALLLSNTCLASELPDLSHLLEGVTLQSKPVQDPSDDLEKQMLCLHLDTALEKECDRSKLDKATSQKQKKHLLNLDSLSLLRSPANRSDKEYLMRLIEGGKFLQLCKAFKHRRLQPNAITLDAFTTAIKLKNEGKPLANSILLLLYHTISGYQQRKISSLTPGHNRQFLKSLSTLSIR